jgi:aspartyl-tRNA(Asn)/glutamyl-tRNA(Gln) amidotransferase subunit B
LNYNKTSLDGLDIKVEHFVSLLELVDSGKITEQQGKKILDKFIPKSFDPKKEIKGKGKISGEGELGKVVEKVIGKNGKAVEDYGAGEEKALHFLIGQVMRETAGRADTEIVRKLLKKKLKD